MYAAPEQGQSGPMKFTTVNTVIPTAYTVHATPLTALGRNPTQCICGNCRTAIVTRVERTSGFLTWLLCLVLILFGCGLGCCFIPFCISDLKNVQHYCPCCNAFISEYRPL